MLTRVLRRLVVMTTQKQTKQYRRDKQAAIPLPVVVLKGWVRFFTHWSLCSALALIFSVLYQAEVAADYLETSSRHLQELDSHAWRSYHPSPHPLTIVHGQWGLKAILKCRAQIRTRTDLTCHGASSSRGAVVCSEQCAHLSLCVAPQPMVTSYTAFN